MEEKDPMRSVTNSHASVVEDLPTTNHTNNTRLPSASSIENDSEIKLECRSKKYLKCMLSCSLQLNVCCILGKGSFSF